MISLLLSLNKATKCDKCDALSNVNQPDTSREEEEISVEELLSFSLPADMYMRHFLNC